MKTMANCSGALLDPPPCAYLPLPMISTVFTRRITYDYGSWTKSWRARKASLAINKSATLVESAEASVNSIPVFEPLASRTGQLREEIVQTRSSNARKIKSLIETIKNMFRSMNDGEISISAYDTAWIALVPALDGSPRPHFPSSLHWIIHNQLSDGSWGDPFVFLVHDRIINTLACVIALKTWSTVPHAADKGLRFLRENIPKMDEEEDAHIPIGFEIVFPSLVEYAKTMNLDLPFHSPVLGKFYDERDRKLKRIPLEVLHSIPSTLLHSLEGLRDKVNWQKLLKLQSKDGSFLFSPASTACALAHTGDPNCLRYLTNITSKHNGGAPNVYPVDIFEHLWMVDRLERLGIARYFENEIRESLEYVYRYWTDRGIAWARESPVQDVDDTAMAFRLLRLHGFHVSEEVFSHFKKDDEFFCFAGQTNQAVTGMYNLYRASQLLFPGESILEDAKAFTLDFLQHKQASNQLADKWIIAKGLAGEVEYALNFPWYASQPRVETRMYLDFYREDDVWIGKSLYRMPLVNNKAFIELAKIDFNVCQSVHRKELDEMISWYKQSRLEVIGLEKETIVNKHFLSLVALFEPEMSSSRLAWARSAVLITAVRSLFSRQLSSPHQKFQFIGAFKRWDITPIKLETAKLLLACLFRTIDLISLDAMLVQGRNIGGHLRDAWDGWLRSEANMDTKDASGVRVGREGEIIVLSAVFLGNEIISEDTLGHPDFSDTVYLTNAVCSLLRQKGAEEMAVTKTMRELTWRAHTANAVPRGVKQACLSVAKSFYYAARCRSEEMRNHVQKVVFQAVPVE